MGTWSKTDTSPCIRETQREREKGCFSSQIFFFIDAYSISALAAKDHGVFHRPDAKVSHRHIFYIRNVTIQ